MGVVKRQGIKQSLVTWVAMVIGAVNAFFIFPAALTTEQLGIITFIRDSAILISPLLFWGGSELIVRFFPIFRNDEKKHHGFLFLLQIIFAFGILVLTPLFFFFKRTFLDFFAKESPLYEAFAPYILPFAILITYGAVFSSHALNFKRAAVPALFNEIVPKLGLMLLTLGFMFQWIGFSGVFYGQLAVYGFILIAQIGYLAHLGELHLRPDFSFLKKPLVKEMGTYGAYAMIGSLGSRLSDRISTIILPLVTSLSDGGVYTIGFFISEALDAPRKAIARIVSPLLSEKWKEGKLAEINEIYKKTSLNQLILGLAFLLAIWASVDDLFRIMPNGESFSQGKYVILILGIARLVDMATGVNTEIINYSSHFRYNFYLTIFLGIFNLTCNIMLIPIYKLNGAALSVLISVSTYNLLKFGLVYKKIGIQPFTKPMLATLVIGFIAWFAVAWLPAFDIALLGILIKSLLIMTIYTGLILYFNISPDINQLAATLLAKISNIAKR